MIFLILGVLIGCLLGEKYNALFLFFSYGVVSLGVYFFSSRYNKNIGESYFMQPIDHAFKWPLILCCILPLCVFYLFSELVLRFSYIFPFLRKITARILNK